jgi:hypothetical protein
MSSAVILAFWQSGGGRHLDLRIAILFGCISRDLAPVSLFLNPTGGETTNYILLAY